MTRNVISRQCSNLVAVGGEAGMAHGAGRSGLCAAAAARPPLAANDRAGTLRRFPVTFFLTTRPIFGYMKAILLIESRRTLLETIAEAEQERCPRAGLVTPHSGGPGNPPGWHYDRPARSSLPGDRTVLAVAFP
jgi:hypothetical protein